MSESTAPDQPVREVVRASGAFGILDQAVLLHLAHRRAVPTTPPGNAALRKRAKVIW